MEIGENPREGIIIECPLNGLFHNLGIIIIQHKRPLVRMVDNNNNNDWLLGNLRECFLLFVINKMTVTNILKFTEGFCVVEIKNTWKYYLPCQSSHIAVIFF